MSSLDDIMAILRSQQANVQSKQGALQRASAPQQTAFRNEGQSGMDVLRRGEPDQRRALMEIGLGLMGHQTGATPGQTIGASVSRGFDILDEIRGRQRKQGMESGIVGVKAAQDERDTSMEFLDTAMKGMKGPDAPPGGATGYRVEKWIQDYNRMTPDQLARAGLPEGLSDFEIRQMFAKQNVPQAAALAGATKTAEADAERSANQVDSAYTFFNSVDDRWQATEDMVSRAEEYRTALKNGDLNTGPIIGFLSKTFGIAPEEAGELSFDATKNLIEQIGMATFGALSEAEMRALMQTYISLANGEEFNAGVLNKVIDSAEKMQRGLERGGSRAITQIKKFGTDGDLDYIQRVSPWAMDRFGQKSFDSIEAAEAANLPPGTIVTINGRKARID